MQRFGWFVLLEPQPASDIVYYVFCFSSERTYICRLNLFSSVHSMLMLSCHEVHDVFDCLIVFALPWRPASMIDSIPLIISSINLRFELNVERGAGENDARTGLSKSSIISGLMVTVLFGHHKFRILFLISSWIFIASTLAIVSYGNQMNWNDRFVRDGSKDR